MIHRETQLVPSVTVVAPARLHMGFVDVSGSLGRRFGGIGLAVNEISTRVTVHPASETTVSGPGAERVYRCLATLASVLEPVPPVAVQVEQAIPEHAGLGSGTQLALAVGVAVATLLGRPLSLPELAQALDRGQRSGIGIGVFDHGGFVLDGGRGPHTVAPPVLVRLAVPEAWRFILVFDERQQGLHGAPELQAFQQLTGFPREEAARLSHVLLLSGLPALAEADLAGFGAAVTDLQRTVGDYFAPVQGGRFTSPAVGEALMWLATQGATAIGQSSWGPTGFCAVGDIVTAERLVAAVRARCCGGDSLRFVVTSARNYGAEVRHGPQVLYDAVKTPRLGRA